MQQFRDYKNTQIKTRKRLISAAERITKTGMTSGRKEIILGDLGPHCITAKIG